MNSHDSSFFSKKIIVLSSKLINKNKKKKIFLQILKIYKLRLSLIPPNHQKKKSPADTCCVIDKSGSMEIVPP